MNGNFRHSSNAISACKDKTQIFHTSNPNQMSDTFCQESIAEQTPKLREIHQQTPHFAQSSIKYCNDSIYSLQEMANDLAQKGGTGRHPQTKQIVSVPKKANQLLATSKITLDTRITNIQKILSDLSATHKTMKLDLSKVKKQSNLAATSSKKENVAPKNNAKSALEQTDKIKRFVSPKYKVTGNMTERQSERLVVRCKTEAARKQEKMEAELRECTFRPCLVSARKSNVILTLKELETRRIETARDKTPLERQSILRNKEKPKTDRQISNINFKQMKEMIKFEINGLNLD